MQMIGREAEVEPEDTLRGLLPRLNYAGVSSLSREETESQRGQETCLNPHLSGIEPPKFVTSAVSVFSHFYTRDSGVSSSVPSQLRC